ncbi:MULTISPECIES: FixH family protein [Bradyrhizobium]|uniref:Conserved exported protein implied in the cusBA heavy metal efflux RND system n=1 Tax=Bradyrhizobium nanningense TaxID=1325118 RepID=A0A4Q0S6Z5_9BRAD|nr:MULTISPECIES: FixH family protein [Bradyrhizobium]RXH27783.1 conserved exported protein implied in the cusBA heavy metal efflux RND system [Bradyrhizobium nanningense]RXH34151.1 conserved exported protein implied in the cusBA heavy metal efflux RND system [Bradyrhizobium nanningense]TQF32923.1 conserved exported protein implied in the cusBA heavy metal efflux RND system [Bradyrhizobium sp. UNPA324]
MLSRFSTAALAATLSLAASAAMAGAGEYVFEPVNAQMKKGDDVTLSVRLTNKQTGKPVADAVIFKTRVDMAPDGMAEMESAVAPLPSKEPGVYAFRTDLPMAGRYQVTLSAKVQGEAETVTGKVVVTATK